MIENIRLYIPPVLSGICAAFGLIGMARQKIRLGARTYVGSKAMWSGLVYLVLAAIGFLAWLLLHPELLV